MKLLTKTNKYYFVFLLFLSPVMITVDYFLVQYIVNSEVNDILKHESERIIFHLKEGGELPYSNHMDGATPVNEAILSSGQFSDTLIYEPYADKLIPYRKYEFTALIGSEKHKISLRHILLETNELIVLLFATTTLIFLLLVIGFYFINRRISKWAWEPFFKNLSKLKTYDITKKNRVHFEATGFTEFEALNDVVTTLMAKVEKDFQTLKEFNENISHEIQTPLAIIRNKMVLLFESQALDEKQLKWVQAAYEEANKLSKIGKSLTLISRIENQEFSRLYSVNIQTTVDNILTNMEEIINFKDLKLKTDLHPTFAKCDPILANILFTNLIKNAVQHNQDGGYIEMLLDQNKFVIENTGKVLKTEAVELFKRFRKDNTATDSLGLGLAINRKICDLYGFQLDYEHHEGKHKFTLLFGN